MEVSRRRGGEWQLFGAIVEPAMESDGSRQSKQQPNNLYQIRIVL